MRVTNSMLISNFLKDLNGNMARVTKLQSQMASGKKYAHVSDDPVSVIYAQQAQHRITRLENYQRNVEVAGNWLTVAENGISELNEVIKNVNEACVDAAGVKSESDRAKAADYVGQMRDHILQTLNTAFGTKYAYGGYTTTGYTDSGELQPPFTVDAAGDLCFNGEKLTGLSDTELDGMKSNMNVLTFDIGLGIDMEVTVNGIELAVFKDKDGNNVNLYNVVNDLYKALKDETTTTDDISAYIKDMQNAQDYLLGLQASIGGKTNRLELLNSRYSQDELNYTQMRSDAQDADYAEVLMNYKMAESIYNAALSAGASIIQPTLMDFLR